MTIAAKGSARQIHSASSLIKCEHQEKEVKIGAYNRKNNWSREKKFVNYNFKNVEQIEKEKVKLRLEKKRSL
jgi:hypothetical protein